MSEIPQQMIDWIRAYSPKSKPTHSWLQGGSKNIDFTAVKDTIYNVSTTLLITITPPVSPILGDSFAIYSTKINTYGYTFVTVGAVGYSLEHDTISVFTWNGIKWDQTANTRSKMTFQNVFDANHIYQKGDVVNYLNASYVFIYSTYDWPLISGILPTNVTYWTKIGEVDVLAAANLYADNLVVGLWNDRGSYNASGNAYPTTGGSGIAGAIKKGDIWTISVAGTLPTGLVVEVGDTVRALQDTPGNTQVNWSILQNNIGYVPENSANKTDTIAGNEGSSTIYASVKGVVDWAIANVFNPKISSDAANDLIVGSDSGAFYKEWKHGKFETSGFNANPGDPMNFGVVNFNPLPPSIDENSIQIFVNRSLQMVSLGDYSNTLGGLQWDVPIAGANVVVYWKYKF